MLGARQSVGVDQLLQLAENEGLAKQNAQSIIEQVRGSLARWREFADQAQVPAIKAAEIGSILGASPRPRSGS